MNDLTGTDARRLHELRESFDDLSAGGIADQLGRLDRRTRAIAYRLLPKDTAVRVFEILDIELRSELISALHDDQVLGIVEELDPDDRAELFDELPAGVATKLMRSLPPEERAMTAALLGYAADSAGRRMTPEVAAVTEDLTVGEALARVRAKAHEVETIYMVPVLAPGRRVVGVVSLRQLLTADPHTPVTDLVSSPLVVSATQSAQSAANLIRENALVAAPVVDAESRLVGVLTVDDVMRLLEQVEDRTSARTGGSEPLRRPYLSAPVLTLVKARVAWLLVLLVAATLTVNVLAHFEDTLEQVVTLALFVPLLIGTGGNAGAQAVTTVVRAMATGDIRSGDLLAVVGREIRTGFLLGSVLALVGFVPAMLVADVRIAAVLAITVVIICTLATMAGAFTPMLFHRLGADPAVVSSPFITTFVDTSGLIVYFLVARAVLGL